MRAISPGIRAYLDAKTEAGQDAALRAMTRAELDEVVKARILFRRMMYPPSSFYDPQVDIDRWNAAYEASEKGRAAAMRAVLAEEAEDQADRRALAAQRRRKTQ